MKYYNLKIFELERKLPILPAPSGINIAGFNIVGDMELLDKSSTYLANYITNNNIKYDIVLTTEMKGVPVAQEIARKLHCDYVCLRKEMKCYMLNPISIKSESITSGKSQYYISEPELNKIRNKHVLFVDDVFSTGATLVHILDFANDYNIDISHALFVLKEGKDDSTLEFKFNNVTIKCCGFLPLP